MKGKKCLKCSSGLSILILINISVVVDGVKIKTFGNKKEPCGPARRFTKVRNYNLTRVYWRLCVPCYLI